MDNAGVDIFCSSAAGRGWGIKGYEVGRFKACLPPYEGWESSASECRGGRLGEWRLALGWRGEELGRGSGLSAQRSNRSLSLAVTHTRVEPNHCSGARKSESVDLEGT